MIISRYHLPTRGTPEMVQIRSSDLASLLGEALAAIERCLPQIRGAIPVQDATSAALRLRRALDELKGTPDE